MSRRRTGSASGMTRPSTCSRPSRASIRRSRCRWPVRRPWNAMSATTAARAGSAEFSAARSRSRSTGSGWRDSCCPVFTRAVGSVKSTLRALSSRKIDFRPCPAVERGLPRGQRVEHLLLGDLAERGVAVGGPRPQDGQRPPQVQVDRGLGPGPAARDGAAAVLHHLKPGAQLADHRFGQAVGVLGEPAVEGAGAVFVETAGGAQDLQHGPDRQVDVGEQRDVAGVDRTVGGVLDAQHDPDPEAGVVDPAAAPAAAGAEFAGAPLERGGSGRVGAPVQPGAAVGGEVAAHLQREQLLARRHRGELRRVPVVGGLGGPGAVAVPGVPGVVVEQVGEEELLPVPVRADEMKLAGRSTPQGGLLVAEPARASVAERQRSSADVARRRRCACCGARIGSRGRAIRGRGWRPRRGGQSVQESTGGVAAGWQRAQMPLV